jgi:lipid-A-disaccharide synthase-like uncharacterized protein
MDKKSFASGALLVAGRLIPLDRMLVGTLCNLLAKPRQVIALLYTPEALKVVLPVLLWVILHLLAMVVLGLKRVV